MIKRNFCVVCPLRILLQIFTVACRSSVIQLKPPIASRLDLTLLKCRRILFTCHAFPFRLNSHLLCRSHTVDLSSTTSGLPSSAAALDVASTSFQSPDVVVGALQVPETQDVDSHRRSVSVECLRMESIAEENQLQELGGMEIGGGAGGGRAGEDTARRRRSRYSGSSSTNVEALRRHTMENWIRFRLLKR